MSADPRSDLEVGGSDRLTRRRMLRRIGDFGIAATATAGVASLLGGASANASTTATTTGKGYPPGSPPPPCSCTTLCSLNLFQCGGTGRCPSGACCYLCDGCGVNGNICLYGCNCASRCYYCQ